MVEKHARTSNNRRFPWMLAVIAMAPLCLALLMLAGRYELPQSRMGGPVPAVRVTAEHAAGLRETVAGEQADPVQKATSQPADVRPDWAVVQEYLDRQRAWRERVRGMATVGLSAEERERRFREALDERPTIRPAIAAATAIVDAGGAHDKTTEAAEFLVMRTGGEPDADEHMYKGAHVLLARAPHGERWPTILMQMDARRFYAPDGRSSAPGVDEFFDEMASGAESRTLRATARYYVAAGLMRSANAPLLSENGRGGRRQRALDAAIGLSVGVEDQPFGGADTPSAPAAGGPGDPHGGSAPRTFAEVEADLIRTIRHATVGGTALDMTGRRLDGTEDSLSAHGGRVVLIDFWATWCWPCVEVLPELRDLVAELPADRFTLLAISVDEELETVTEFREREPMPWINWHAGIDSDMTRAWDVRGFPTYVLVDEQGLILARTSDFTDRFTATVREAVEGRDERPTQAAGEAQDAPDVPELRRAAEQGDPEAQFRLGFAYANGEGVPVDDAESLAWFRRAAEQGHDAAQWVLGTNYLFGSRGVPRDDVAAYMWLHLALSQNDRHDRTPLDQLEARMSQAQIAEAQRLAREWR